MENKSSTKSSDGVRIFGRVMAEELTTAEVDAVFGGDETPTNTDTQYTCDK